MTVYGHVCKESLMKIGPRLTLTLIILASAILYSGPQTVTNFTPVTDSMLEKPDPGDWLMWRRTLDGWGYSPLNQIDKKNVGQLKMVWKRDMTAGVQEATPLVYKGTLYLPTRPM
jgi:alcohol dehydrogenase (cytochrome c)